MLCVLKDQASIKNFKNLTLKASSLESSEKPKDLNILKLSSLTLKNSEKLS